MSSSLYRDGGDIDELEESIRRSRGASCGPRQDLFMSLSRIPIPRGKPRDYYISAKCASRAMPTPKQTWKARSRCARRQRWIAELELFYGTEGAKRIAHWLR
jgi:hypothetical protein